MPEIKKIRKNSVDEKVQQLVMFVSVCYISSNPQKMIEISLISFLGKPQPPRIRGLTPNGSNQFDSAPVSRRCRNDDGASVLQLGHRWQHHSVRQRFPYSFQESLCVLLCFPVALSGSHQAALQIFRGKSFPINSHHDCHDGRLCGTIGDYSQMKFHPIFKSKATKLHTSTGLLTNSNMFVPVFF